MLRAFLRGGTAAVALTLAAPASADDVDWRWRRLHPADYAAIGLATGIAIGDRFVAEPTTVRWRAGGSVDGGLRDAIGFEGEDNRFLARRVSDVTMTALIVWSISDAAVAWGRGEGETAFQLVGISAAAFSFNSAATALIKRAGGRDRPAQTACDRDPAYSEDCAERLPPRSFLSGHTSTAFTAASLLCTHHRHLPLYGGAWDPLTCLTAAMAAGAVGWDRMLADQHYLTDVLGGAALGTFAGAVLPHLFVFAWEEEVGAPRLSVSGDRVHASWAMRW